MIEFFGSLGSVMKESMIMNAEELMILRVNFLVDLEILSMLSIHFNYKFLRATIELSLYHS